MVLGRWSGQVSGVSRADGAVKALTNDERNHGRSISAGGLEALDQLLDLPDLNVLLGLVVLLLVAHVERGGASCGSRTTKQERESAAERGWDV